MPTSKQMFNAPESSLQLASGAFYICRDRNTDNFCNQGKKLEAYFIVTECRKLVRVYMGCIVIMTSQMER